jgi:MFS family permease
METNGSFSNECTQEEQENDEICSEQTSKLIKVGLVIPCVQVASPLLGWLVDRFGTKKAAYAQACLGIVGLTLIILASAMLWDALLFVGYIFLGLHTWTAMLLVVQLGLYFEGHTISRVIFVLNTVFDAGTITYLGLWGIQEGTGASTPSILGGYLGVAIILYALSIYYWTVAVPAGSSEEEEQDTMMAPSTRYSRVERLSAAVNLDEHLKNNISSRSMRRMSTYLGSAVSFLSSRELKTSIHQTEETATNPQKLDGETAIAPPSPSPYVCVADRSPREQLTAAPFLLVCLFFGLNVAGTNWNLVTQMDFLASLGDDDQIYLTIFTLLTPVSILGGPFIDWSILTLGWTATLQIVNVLGVGYQVVKVASDNLNVQIFGFVVYSFYRSFLFGVSFSYLPTLVSGDVIGKAAGIMTGFAGVLNLCLMPVTSVAVENGGADFFKANLGILCASMVPCIVFICALGRYNVLEVAAKEAKNSGPAVTQRLSAHMAEFEELMEEDEDEEEDKKEVEPSKNDRPEQQ